MKRKKICIGVAVRFFLMGGAMLFFTMGVQAFSLVEEGNPNATIVIPENATEREKHAAAILQEYIQRSTGAKLLVATAASGNVIHIGQTRQVVALKLGRDKLDEDGFLLQGIDNSNYVIVGGGDWGTEFGVYDFLERYLGVRWLMPTELGIDVPQHKTIDVPATRIIQEPVYLSREFAPVYIDGKPKPTDLGWWGRFNRARGRIVFNHNLLKLFPVSEFGKTHPEIYPILNGKRYIPRDDRDHRWNPNLSNPMTIDIAVAKIEKYFEENPQAVSFSLGMNDSARWDESEISKSRRNGKKNFLNIEDVSDEYFTWANEVVTRVLKKYPDKWFGTLAYMNLIEPPTKVNIHPRIVPFITYDRMRWEDPKLRVQGEQMTKRWTNICAVVGWYDYAYGSNYLIPRVFSHRLQKNFAWGEKNQVKYSFAELYPNWGEGPKAWLYAKLLWNPNQDVDALLDDWYERFAGHKAAPSLKAFYDIWEKFWKVDIFKSPANHDEREILFLNGTPKYLLGVPQSYIEDSDNALETALKLADTPTRKARITKLTQMWEFYKASIINYQAEHQLMQAPLQTEEAALEMVEQAERVMFQVRKRRELTKAFAQDPLFKESVPFFVIYPATNGENWGISLVWNLLPWAKKSARVEQKLRELAANDKSSICEQAKLVLKFVDGQPQLLSSNGSFEEGNQGWTFWDHGKDDSNYRQAEWTVSSEQVAHGAMSLKIKGLQLGGPYQRYPYKPGNYLVTASFYVPEISRKGDARMVIHALGTRGENLGGRFALPSTPLPLQPGKWYHAVIPFVLPEDNTGTAVSLRVLVEMENYAPDETVYMDNMEVHRIED